ncbi:MAG: hypothetical protein GY820_02710, partial [Gammaproteobacteria bacterium]|nr:hypothetical protein [Gammaproteobacteria bacterium]
KEAPTESKADEEEEEEHEEVSQDVEKEGEEEEDDDDEEEWEDDPEELRVIATTPEALARLGIPVRKRWKPFLVSKSFVRENANMIAKIKQLEQYKQVTMLERAVAEQNMKSMRRAMKRLERLEKNRQIAAGIYHKKVPPVVIKLEDDEEQAEQPAEEHMVIDVEEEEQRKERVAPAHPEDGSSSSSSSDSSEEDERSESEESESEEGEKELIIAEEEPVIKEEVVVIKEEDIKKETPEEEKMDESEPPLETDKQVPVPKKLISSIEAEKEHQRAYEAGELDGEENVDRYHESLSAVTQAREREEREELLKEVIEERARENLPPMTDTEQELAIQLLDTKKRVKKQKESARERSERAFGKPSTSAEDRSPTATLQTSSFKVPLPPTNVESPFYLAQAKTGIGVERKLEGRQLLPGGLWKPVGFFRDLSPSDNYQKNPTPKRIGNKP